MSDWNAAHQAGFSAREAADAAWAKKIKADAKAKEGGLSLSTLKTCLDGEIQDKLVKARCPNGGIIKVWLNPAGPQHFRFSHTHGTDEAVRCYIKSKLLKADALGRDEWTAPKNEAGDCPNGSEQSNGSDKGSKQETPDKGWRSHVFTAAALRTTEFPPISYIVPGIIPEGLTILAGRPKIGKSWMALDLAIGIAMGKPVLGGIDVEQGDVLYCCLEDNPRRLKRRITKLLSPFGNEWPERLTLATRWRRLDQGGVEDIEAWCGTVPKPRLVLLDTLAGVRPARSGSDTLYEGDYRALQDIHRLANDRGMGATALHHTRKMDADDPVDTISGSLGLAGCADTCLILARSSSGTTLYVRGRDIEEGERAVMFGVENCRWSLLGEAAEIHRTENQKKILAALEGAAGLLDAAAIAAVSELPNGTVVTTLHRLAAKGEVVQVSRGRWAYPGKPFAAPKEENHDPCYVCHFVILELKPLKPNEYNKMTNITPHHFTATGTKPLATSWPAARSVMTTPVPAPQAMASPTMSFGPPPASTRFSAMPMMMMSFGLKSLQIYCPFGGVAFPTPTSSTATVRPSHPYSVNVALTDR